MRLEFYHKNLIWCNKPDKKNASASYDILYHIKNQSTRKPDIMPDTFNNKTYRLHPTQKDPRMKALM